MTMEITRRRPFWSALHSLFAIVVIVPRIASLSGPPTAPVARIQVCQNRDCCRRFRGPTHSLYQVLQLLLPLPRAVSIESTGCLGQCDKGPNLCLSGANDQTQRFIHGVADPAQAAVQLGALSFDVPSQLLAAVTVMDRAEQANSWAEKEVLLSSVVRALDRDERLKYSTACLRARVMRAEAALQEGIKASALDDIIGAITAFKAGNMGLANNDSAFLAQAFRVAADCYESLGQFEKALECLEQWATLDRAFQSKAAKEIERINKQRLAQS